MIRVIKQVRSGLIDRYGPGFCVLVRIMSLMKLPCCKAILVIVIWVIRVVILVKYD